MFNKKVQDNEELKVNIKEIIATNTSDPYDDTYKLREYTQQEPNDIGFDFEGNEDLEDYNDMASLGGSDGEIEEEKGIDIEDEGDNDHHEMKVEELILQPQPSGILKVTLDTFKSEDDDMLEDKTIKKLKKHNNHAVTPVKGQAKRDTFFQKKD